MTPRATGRGSSTVREPAPAHHHKETTMHPHRSRIITVLAVLFAVGLADTLVFAQGVSPWLNAVDVLQQAFTGPLARGLSQTERAEVLGKVPRSIAELFGV